MNPVWLQATDNFRLLESTLWINIKSQTNLHLIHTEKKQHTSLQLLICTTYFTNALLQRQANEETLKKSGSESRAHL